MTVQRLHPAIAPIDILTRSDMEAMHSQHLEDAMRTKLRGVDSIRLSRVIAPGNGGTLNLFASPNESPAGPEQGDVWMIRRIIVKSTSFTDNAKYIIFRGSTPSDLSNAYGITNFVEGINPPVNQPTPPSSISVGASPFTFVNTQPYTVNVTVTGGTVSAITVNGASTGATSGTFALTPDSNITVTYTGAPTMTQTNAASNVPMGLNVNLGFYPASGKAILLQPGEQIYAQVFNTFGAGVQYQLDGEGIRVPAEMKGKLLT